MSWQSFQIGTIFEMLHVSWESIGMTPDPKMTLLAPRFSSVTHWVLVFTTAGTSHSIELENYNGTIAFSVKRHSHELPANYFGRYQGYLSDLYERAQDHPMNGQMYSTLVNNCQHWVARYLHSLAALTEIPRSVTPGTISIYDHHLLTVIFSVVDARDRVILHLLLLE